jgi:hypothetical protein
MHYGGNYDVWRTNLQKYKKEHPRLKKDRQKKAMEPIDASDHPLNSGATSVNFGLWSNSKH